MREHGHAKTGQVSGTYLTWQSMKRRCFDTKWDKYPLYGARGITVCERWLVFENFLDDMGERPAGRTLDRRNNDGNYELDNCKWATPWEQAQNRRPNPLKVLCKRGHPLIEGNVSPHRQCLTCRKIYDKARVRDKKLESGRKVGKVAAGKIVAAVGR